jgi:pyruvate dehydrogenase E2 component (dihydrolipoamide acetyltransferase)
MSDTVTMPKLGFDMQEGTLVRWVKLEGDNVSKGDVLAEIETDKATVEVESQFSGVIARHLVSQGDVVPVGTPIAIVAAPGEAVEATAVDDSNKEPAKQAPVDAKTGDLNPPKAGGEKQAAAETPGQAAQAPAAQKTDQERSQAAEKPVEEIPPAESESEPAEDGRIKASPLARKVATDNGVDLRRVKGSGPGGRITRADVESALKTGVSAAPAPAAPAAVPTPPVAAPATATAPAPAPAATAAQPQAVVPPAPIWSGAVQAPEDQVVKVNRLRGAIMRRMVESKTQIPHFYVTRTYNVEKLLDLRKQMNAYLPDDQKLTVNDFVIKAVALTLRQFPNVNASLRGDEVVRHGHVNIGSAVSIEGGLMTVVVKDADQKPLRLISAEMREYAGRARAGKVRTDDIEGSTFSISNMGMYDVDHFIAIINPPEVGILAVGSAMQVPVVENGEIKVGTRMKATISIDHRVSDGAEAARFMQTLALFLEEPMRLML